MSEPRNILITRELTDEQLVLAQELDLRVTTEPAIEIRFRDDWLSVQDAFRDASNVIYAFTSKNGVIGFERFRRAGIDFPQGPFYAVGGRTAEALSEIGLQALWPERQDGVGLAKTIISDIKRLYKDGVTVFHFCGNRRRDELRQMLSQSEVIVKDLVVYSTELKKMKLDKEPDAVLFYSPSAVQAYRNSGGFQKIGEPELFAIGETTARELSIESGRHVHVSPEPDTEVFLRYVASVLNEPT